MAAKKSAKETAKKAARAPKPDPEEAVLATIAALPDWERAIAERLHALIRDVAPDLAPKLWYGQPAYAKAGKVVCFFRGAEVDGERYVTFGFSGHAAVDDGTMWPTAYALTDLTDADAERIAALVARAAA